MSLLHKHLLPRSHLSCQLIATVSLKSNPTMSKRILLPSKSSSFPTSILSSSLPSIHKSLPSRTLHYSPALLKHPPTSTSTSTPAPPLPTFNLVHALRDSSPAVRYTVYAALALMATAESTFWLTVLKAKFFPSSSDAEKERAEVVLSRLRQAIKTARGNWMRNYGAYFGGYIWGIGER
ncbi:hypothetical protein BDU57DRAFT_519247 [Ampelomyces quisqualis]|uniref:Uncharacterized protein n=1 Tax=Ampelomyces quisqualis TaxID=50730 RepID=A0A6A5QIH8_AMPQU|nr:hypothetical protein BDU57DRAFT_519247 [Ampelomyces quisqualis]